MNRYWDFSERERAALTEDQVRAFLDVELMEKGVAKVKAPSCRPVVEVKIPRKAFARIKFPTRHGSEDTLDVAFPDIESAHAFLALQPLIVSRDWETDSTSARPIVGAVFSGELAGADDVMAATVALKANKANKEENDRAERAYREAVKKVDEATRDVWSDWRECRGKAERAQRIAETRAEYLRLAGTAELAETFLAKAYDSHELAFEREWSAP